MTTYMPNHFEKGQTITYMPNFEKGHSMTYTSSPNYDVHAKQHIFMPNHFEKGQMSEIWH